MKTAFFSHFPLSDGERNDLWRDGVLVPDANVLLGLYRYSNRTRGALLEVLAERGGRLWIPRQFATEFFYHREEVIITQSRAYGATAEKLASVLKELESHRHPFAPRQQLGSLRKMVAHIKQQESRILKALTDDPVLHRLGELFDGCLGDELDPADLVARHEQAAERFAKKIPPGYADEKQKAEPARRYADFVGWSQVLDYFSKAQKPAIFVTDDTKDDWFLRVGGRTIGPRRELLEEFRLRCGNAPLRLYTAEQLVDHARERGLLGRRVAADAIAEMAHVREDLERRPALLKPLSPEFGDKPDPPITSDSDKPKRDAPSETDPNSEADS